MTGCYNNTQSHPHCKAEHFVASSPRGRTQKSIKTSKWRILRVHDLITALDHHSVLSLHNKTLTCVGAARPPSVEMTRSVRTMQPHLTQPVIILPTRAHGERGCFSRSCHVRFESTCTGLQEDEDCFAVFVGVQT